jgi:aldose 1-epimerase
MQITDFGKTDTGASVQVITLAAGDLTATILTLGCTLQSAHLKGTPHSLTLGSDLLSDYENTMLYFGAIVGPVANRITGAKTTLNGHPLTFDANENGNLLHGGGQGTHAKIWDIAATTPNSTTLTLTLPAGEGGFPGTRQIRATYEITAPATLRLTITATTDTPTLMNFANHSYWNLDGTPTWTGHSLQIAADHYTATDAALLPTGRITPVAATLFDFRKARKLALGEPALDTNFCLSAAKAPLRPVATLTGASGLALRLATTEPGLQIYDAQRTARPGHAKYEGFAIEAQGWPDAPNHANFPSVQITPDAPYGQTTEWRFTKP